MTNDATTSTFLDHLRTRTNTSHQKLESLPVSASILSETITVADYARYLQLMHDVVQQTETLIFPILSDVVPDLDARRKTQLLENDLAFIGATIQPMNRVFDATDFSLPFALGIMYTVEGSSLGGRFILKNIQSVLGFDENNGAKYFAGYGNKTGSHWKNFLHVLTEYEQQHGDSEAIIAGAQFAFDAIHDHFLTAGRHEN
ncbi:biliverdin-producing heme oxygenase [Flavobacterium sp.]|uniref:biliverdin-producing heme oxygenase n=1 Tax=Flavobacterium sp. TaxID=239 RepID=UPI0039E3DA3D